MDVEKVVDAGIDGADVTPSTKNVWVARKLAALVVLFVYAKQKSITSVISAAIVEFFFAQHASH